MRRTSTLLARWGLLITTMIMGASMVITGVIGYLGALQSAEAVIKANATDTLFVVRRGFMRMGQPDQGVLEKLHEPYKSRGVRFIGLVDVNGQVKIGSGEPAVPLDGLPEKPPRLGPEIMRIQGGKLVRSVSYLVPMQRGRLRDVKTRLNKQDMSDPRVVVDFEPLVANEIENRSMISLVLSLSAAIVLLGAALVFWRMSRQAERINARLEQDRRLAVLGEMSAVLGHELRNPLTALKGHAQLLGEKLSADHPGRSGIETVVREATRLESLTGKILEFARTGELQVEQVRPDEVVRAAIDQTGSSRIRAEMAESLPPWPLDSYRVQQVLSNLFDNALQASPDDAEVVCSVICEAGHLVINVRDRGEGLPKGEEQNVFEPFHTKRTHGTGLGLAVAKRIVEGHGGTIEAYNHPEGGALFVTRFPRH